MQEIWNWPGVDIPITLSHNVMHSEIIGEFSKHFLRVMRHLLQFNSNIWPTVHNSIRTIMINEGEKSIGRPFSNEANYIRRVRTAAKHKLYCRIEAVFSTIITVGNNETHLKLLFDHSNYHKILVKHEISREEVNSLHEPLFNIRRKGKDLYTDDNWITTNSHLVLHFPLNIERFGGIRNTWVYSFESQMGILKRWIMDHRNNTSEGLTMMQFIWRLILSKSIINQ